MAPKLNETVFPLKEIGITPVDGAKVIGVAVLAVIRTLSGEFKYAYPSPRAMSPT